MDKVEARLLLQAYRPNGADAAHPLFAEALALAESDPELKAWWQAQQEFDRRVASKLEQVAPPADLRDTILAGRKIEQLTPRPHLPWLAIAGAVAILAAVGWMLLPHSQPSSSLVANTEFADSALAFLGNDGPSLGTTSPDSAKLIAWLQQQHAPIGAIPGKMTSIPTVGCQKFTVHGHDVSLICFTLANNKIVHLFVVDRSALKDAPPVNVPQFAQHDDWSTASWSDDAHSYMMATQAGADTLKQLL
jgi:hypothetical protein